METQRAFAAIAISLLILFGYQYFFMPAPQPEIAVQQQSSPNNIAANSAGIAPSKATITAPQAAGILPLPGEQQEVLNGRDIAVQTKLYNAIISENGGTIKSFTLHGFRESLAKDSPDKELITNDSQASLPLLFNWGNTPASTHVSHYAADREAINTSVRGNEKLTLTSSSPALTITRAMTFSDESYLIGLDFVVRNNSSTALQGAPTLSLTNKPFSGVADNSYLFEGPAVYLNNELEEIKTKDLEDGPKIFSGDLTWAAYEDTYFMCSIIPKGTTQQSVTITLTGEDTVTSNVSATRQEILQPGEELTYHYNIYFGPKKLKTLQATGHELGKAVDFGYFDIIAKPTLYLLNFFHTYFHNYGIAIILVTIIFKLIFWPISHKGMKSMKNMQKIQPKMAKLREKFKDDKERLNQEMITLYKTYKINPLGGCLPMVLQIPVFFALYKVLLQTIELRHAPFMLWITDLSAPDRLFIGIDIPFLGGIPVLTLLMGASMFLQQKMTPSTGDPTQAKMMMLLPIVFTFMFINFASGLVLYWFINNLLSVGQQYFINRSVDA